MDLPNPAPVLDLIQGFRLSKTMFTAVSLGIFDRLHEGPADLPTLARKLGTSGDALQRLLDSCVGLGFLRKENGSYANAPVADAYLTRSSPHTLTGYILYSDRALYQLWGNLEAAVCEGSNRWEQTFGEEVSLFDHFFRTQEARRDFLSGMDGMGRISSPAVVSAFDLGRFQRIVDLGGATGHLALEACGRYSQLRATIFELPGVLAVAREYVLRSPHAERIELAAGDFFLDPLPEGDLYALGRILHDWAEPNIRTLLRKVWDRLPSGGAVLIAEKLLADDKSGPLAALMQSLNMLVCTEGKERTLAEYTALLNQSGFSRVEAKVTNAPLDAILAVKV